MAAVLGAEPALLAAQIELRNNRRLQAAMRSNRLPAVRRLATSISRSQQSIRREQIENLPDLGFVERKENVILLGPRASGRHISRSASRSPPHKRMPRYCGTLVDLINSLEEAQAAGRLHQLLNVLTHPALLVVDEIGYLPIRCTGAMLF